jgi:mannitol/fructose-specific phosphotransferase system IIA component (Ntr-type)
MISSIGPELRSSLFVSDLGPRKRDAALLEMARRAMAVGIARDAGVVHRALLQRERFGTTAIGRGVALPNARSIAVTEPGLAVARSRRGIDWGAPDDEAVHLILLLLSPAETALGQHHDLLARLVAAVRSARARQRLLEAVDSAAVVNVLREALP